MNDLFPKVGDFIRVHTHGGIRNMLVLEVDKPRGKNAFNAGVTAKIKGVSEKGIDYIRVYSHSWQLIAPAREIVQTFSTWDI